MNSLDIKTPRWSVPLLGHRRYKGAKGGRGSGKSHFFAESTVENHILNPDHQTVCVREIQKSLKFSAKKLIEDKIVELGVSHLFDITQTEIRNKAGRGIMIFQGLQDHTADSIKSLEGFNTAWVEEAQSISKRSMELLLPTIRAEGSEIWFSWNPDSEDDPVETMIDWKDEDSVCVHVNFHQNPFCPDELKKEAERHKRNNPDTFDHVWLGHYNTRKDSQVFRDKFEIKDFEPDYTFGNPLHGLDFGFAMDPTAAVRLFIKDNCLYVRYEAGRRELELDDTKAYVCERIPEIENFTIRADSARPEAISYLQRHGLPHIIGVTKWAGSVEDGIGFMKNFDRIYIHPSCEQTAQEFRLYSYKVDSRTGDIVPKLEDKNNHFIDAIRYALEPMIKNEHHDWSSLA